MTVIRNRDKIDLTWDGTTFYYEDGNGRVQEFSNGEGSLYSENGEITETRLVNGDSTGELAFFGFSSFGIEADDLDLGSGAVTRISGTETTFNGFESLYTKEVILEEADILGMFATPYEVITGVANKTIVVVDVQYTLLASLGGGGANVPYLAGGDLLLQTETGGEDVSSGAPEAAYVKEVTNTVYTRVYGNTSNYYQVLNGEGVTLTNDTAAFTTGNRRLRVRVTYRLYNKS